VPLLRCQIWGELVRFPDASQNSRTDPDLKAAGWRQVSGGKGSHRKFKHDKFPGSVMIPGHENDDAKPYLEKQVRNAAKGKAHERK